MKIKSLTGKFGRFQTLFIFIIVITFYSCNNRKDIPIKTQEEQKIREQEDREKQQKSESSKPIVEERRIAKEILTKSIEKNQLDSITQIMDSLTSLDDYIVKIAVEENIKMDETGELRVWIGAKDHKIQFDSGMVQDETSIPASIGQYARITPYAPDFKVNPSEIKCIRIHPSGSDVRFALTPKKTGNLKVSANIELFYSVDCTGASVPKTAKTLSVFVTIDKKNIIGRGLKEIGIVFWNKFLSFWGAFVSLLFALLLFMIRRKLKRKTGFDDKKE